MNVLKLNPAKEDKNEKIIIKRRRIALVFQEIFWNKPKKCFRLSHNKKSVNKNAVVIKIDESIWMVCAEFNKEEDIITLILEYNSLHGKR